MTVVLNLSHDIEQRLRMRASLAGKPLSTLLEEITRDAAYAGLAGNVATEQSTQPALSTEEWLSRFDAIAQSAPNSPVLSPQATRRESIYSEDE